MLIFYLEAGDDYSKSLEQWAVNFLSFDVSFLDLEA